MGHVRPRRATSRRWLGDSELDGFPGQYVEDPILPGAIYVNDYVTVDCLHTGPRQIALKITVTEVEEP